MVDNLDASGSSTGGMPALSPNVKAEPVMAPIDGTTPVPPGYPSVGPGQ